MELLRGVFFSVLLLSFSGTLLFFAVWATGRLFRKQISRTFTYYLWLLVAFRMLTPFQPEWGLGQLVESPADLGKVAATVTAGAGQLFGGQSGQNTGAYREYNTAAFANSPAGAELAWEHEDALQKEGGVSPYPEYFRYERNLVYLWAQAAEEAVYQPGNTAMSFLADCFAVLWLTVAVAQVSSHGMHYRAFLTVLKELRSPVEDERIMAIYRQAARDTAVKENSLPALYQADCVSSPMLAGLFRPAIVIPREMINEALEEGETRQLLHILSHELTHFKRKDIAYKWLLLLIKAVHWFNPCAYILSKKAAADCEMSCDEAVCRRLSGEARICYGNALLKAASTRKTEVVKINEEFCTSMGKEGKEMLNRLQVVKAAGTMNWIQKGICCGLAAVLCVTGLWVGLGKAQAQAETFDGPEDAYRQALGQLAQSLVVDEGKGTLSFTAPAENMQVLISGAYIKEGRAYYTEDYLQDESAIGQLVPGTPYTTDMYALEAFDFDLEIRINSAPDEAQPEYHSVFMSRPALDVLFTQERYPDWQTAYTAVIRDLLARVEYPYEPQTAEGYNWLGENQDSVDVTSPEKAGGKEGFSLYDIDGDGIPELLVKASTRAGAAGCYVYTFQNSRPQYLGNLYGTVYTPLTPKAENKLLMSEESHFIMSCGVLIHSAGQQSAGQLQTSEEMTFYELSDTLANELPVTVAAWAAGQQEGALSEADTLLLEETASWAEAYASREGLIRYQLLTEEKQAVFFLEDRTVVSDEELFLERGFISLRGSSPWVEQYSIRKTGKREFIITYFMRTSAPEDYYVLEEWLRFGQVDGQWKVEEYDTSPLAPLSEYLSPLTVEEAVAKCVERYSRSVGFAWDGKPGYGFLLLGTEQADRDETLAYVIVMTGLYEFQDGSLMHGPPVTVEPVLVHLYQTWNGSYLPDTVETPLKDETYWEQVFRMFPEEYHETVKNSQMHLHEDYTQLEEIQEELWQQFLDIMEAEYLRMYTYGPFPFRELGVPEGMLRDAYEVSFQDLKMTEAGRLAGIAVVKSLNGEIMAVIGRPEYVSA